MVRVCLPLVTVLAALPATAAAQSADAGVPDAVAPDATPLPADAAPADADGPPPPPAIPPPPPLAPPVAAIAPAPPAETVVVAPRPVTAASSQTVRDRDFLLRAHPRPADILMTVPGMYVIQHAGGGKANQYFLRGFDADHGTDVALSVDGVPVNAVSHGHGQGYADLHFVIPELIERVEVRKGPYCAVDGDFATAGAFNLVNRSKTDADALTLGVGQFDTYRALGITSPGLGDWKLLFAGELYATNGPFTSPEALRRANLFGKISHDVSFGGRVSLTVTSYVAGWNASGQIPLRAVREGLIGRFDSIDPNEGGGAARQSVVADYHRFGQREETRLTAYLYQTRLNLYSDFTFFSVDPVNGDMIEQTDQRVVAGLRASQRWLINLGNVEMDTIVGLQARSDRIDNGLFHAPARKRIERLVDTHVGEDSAALFAQADVAWRPWLRTLLGVRGDLFGFDVDDHLEPLDPAAERTSGVARAFRASPKASLIVTPHPGLDLFLNFGTGFHSNDARGVVREFAPVTPLTRAIGYEAGARAAIAGRLDLAMAAFGLDLASETVWVGDAGTTESRGPTRRLGIEGEARLRLRRWLWADLDASFVNARYTANAGNGNAVALAPNRLISGGLSARHPRGPFGRVGVFHIGDRPATEDGFLIAEGFTRLDAVLGFHHERFELSLTLQNLTGTVWREAQFGNVSRLQNETTPASCPAGTRPVTNGTQFAGCEDVHFTPGAPINVFGSLTAFF